MDPIHDNFAGSNPQDGGSLMPNDRPQNPAGPVVGGELQQNPVVAQNSVAPQDSVGNPPVVAQDSMTQKNSVTPQDPAITRQNPVISQNPVMRQNSTATNEMRANIQNILNNNNTNLNVPVGSDGGDVVLSNAQPKNKRLTIIVAVIVALVLFGVGLWYVLTYLTPGAISERSLRSEFNKYANYLLYETESDKKLEGEYDRNSSYKIGFAIDNDEIEYLGKLGDYWNGFYSIFDEKRLDDENLDSELISTVLAQNDMMQFVEDYVDIDHYSDDDLLKIFLKDGKDKTYNAIENNYKTLLESNYNAEINYANIIMSANKALVNTYEAYKNAGCITDGIIDDSCSYDNSSIPETKAEYNYWLEYKEIEMLSDLAPVMAENCWVISGKVNNGK